MKRCKRPLWQFDSWYYQNKYCKRTMFLEHFLICQRPFLIQTIHLAARLKCNVWLRPFFRFLGSSKSILKHSKTFLSVSTCKDIHLLTSWSFSTVLKSGRSLQHSLKITNFALKCVIQLKLFLSKSDLRSDLRWKKGLFPQVYFCKFTIFKGREMTLKVSVDIY